MAKCSSSVSTPTHCHHQHNPVELHLRSGIEHLESIAVKRIFMSHC